MYLHPRLLSLALDVRWRIILSALVGMLAAAAGVARLAVAALVIAEVVRGEASFESLGWPLAGMAGLIAARAVLQYWQEVMSHHTASIVKVKLRERLYRHSLALGPGHFDASRTGDALMSLAEGVERLEAFFGRYLPQMIVAAAAPLVIFAVMALIDLRTGLIFLAFALFTLVIPNLFHRWTRERSMARRDAYGALGADFLDAVQGLATLKAFGQSGARGELLAERARRLFRATMGVLAANAATGALTILGITGGAAVALGWGAARVADGDLELRALLIVLMLGVEIFRPLRELVQLYHDGMIAMSSAEGIFAIMDSPVAVADPALRPAQGDRDGGQGDRDGRRGDRDSGRGDQDSGQGDRDAVANGQGLADGGRDGMRAEVVFEGVGYAYNRGRRPALRGLSFTLRDGETLGLVGPSGAGKSTVVWLMLRFFDPQEGAIRLGGRDLRDIPLEELRRQISVVTQDTYLFHGTVAENLRFGNPGASQDELEAAARAANAHDFIGHLPDGYETVVGERAVRLSGGQKQRIAIARALLKDAPILVLDEALSSVDAENEAVIQEALERLMAGRTTLIIAHRLSSVVNADRILALDDGRLAESGSHSELAAAGGLYATLMAQQQERGDFDVLSVAASRSVAEPRAAAHPAAPVDVGAFMPRTAHSGEGHHHHHAAPPGNRGDGDHHHGHSSGHHGQDGGHHGGRGHGRGSASGDGGDSGGREVEADAFIPRPAHIGGGNHHHHAGHHRGAAHKDGVGDGRPLGVIAVWGRLLGLVMPWRGELVLTFLLGVAHHSAVIGVGVVSALLVGQVITGGDLTLLLILLGALTPLAAFFIWTESWAAHDLAYRLLAEMRVDLYRKLDPLAPAYMTRRRSGDLVSVVGGDVETVEFFFAHTVTPAFTAVVVPGAVVAVLAVIAWPMALAVAPFLAAVALSPFWAQRRSERLGEELRRQLGEVHAHMVDSIQGMREISAFGRGAARTAEMVDNSWRFAGYQLRFLKERAFQVGFIESMTALGGLVVLTVGVWLLTNGNISRPELILAVVLSVAAFAPVSDIARTMKQLMETLAAARRLFAIHDAPVTVADGPGVDQAGRAGRDDDGAASGSAAPSLAFDGVGFAYGAGESEALREVSFTVAPGDTVALVGRSGAGKTTCANLVMRFWDPTSGAVRLDGRDLRDFKLDDLRGQVALVSQDTYLFNASVRDNIRLGRAGASDAELEAAARQANCHDFITAFPDGYDTVVGERGMQLSGGQRQRIAIARALLKNAPMLILDEATSHLDAVSESQLRQALEHLMRGRTTMVIAHRLSTIRDADSIVVLDYGRAVEQGSHQELLERGGLYARLVATQLVSAGDGGDGGHSGGDGGHSGGDGGHSGDGAGGWAGVPGGGHQHRHHHHH